MSFTSVEDEFNGLVSANRLSELSIALPGDGGSFGSIRICSKDKEIVAVKVIKSLPKPKITIGPTYSDLEVVNSKAKLQERIYRESSMLRLLQSEHVVKFHFVVTKPSESWIVLELAQGSVWDIIADSSLFKGNLPFSLYLAWLTDLASALSFIHRKEVKHLDIKCENMLLFQGLTVKLCAFGLARESDDNSDLTTVVGTAPFIAPEVRRKLPSSTKADIFSFVMTAVQMFSRATPLMYDSERQAEDNFGELQKVDSDAYDMLIRCVDFEASNRPDSDSLVETFSALIRNSKVVDPRRSPVSVDFSVVSEIESKLDSVSDEKLAHVIHPTKDVQMASMLTWLSEYCPDISQDNRVLFVNQIVQIGGATSVQHVKEIALRIGSHLTDMADLLDGVDSSTPEEALPIVKWLRSLSITTADNEAIRISISDACIIANALIHEDNPLPPMPPGLLEQRILNRAQAKARSLSPVNFNPVVITHSVEKSGITSREASITSLATAFNSEGFSGKHTGGFQSRGANTFLSSGAGTDKNSTIAPSRDPAELKPCGVESGSGPLPGRKNKTACATVSENIPVDDASPTSSESTDKHIDEMKDNNEVSITTSSSDKEVRGASDSQALPVQISPNRNTTTPVPPTVAEGEHTSQPPPPRADLAGKSPFDQLLQLCQESPPSQALHVNDAGTCIVASFTETVPVASGLFHVFHRPPVTTNTTNNNNINTTDYINKTLIDQFGPSKTVTGCFRSSYTRNNLWTCGELMKLINTINTQIYKPESSELKLFPKCRVLFVGKHNTTNNITVMYYRLLQTFSAICPYVRFESYFAQHTTPPKLVSSDIKTANQLLVFLSPFTTPATLKEGAIVSTELKHCFQTQYPTLKGVEFTVAHEFSSTFRVTFAEVSVQLHSEFLLPIVMSNAFKFRDGVAVDIQADSVNVNGGAARMSGITSFINRVAGGRQTHSRHWNLLPFPGSNSREAWKTVESATPAPKVVTVGVVDSGVYKEHSCFVQTTIDLYSAPPTSGTDTCHGKDDTGHGTKVTSVICGRLPVDEAHGVEGVVNTACKVMSAKVPSSTGLLSHIARQIDFAAKNGSGVVNVSMSSGPADGQNIGADMIYSAPIRLMPSLEKSIKDASDAGVIVVVAAGNYCTDNDKYILNTAYERSHAISFPFPHSYSAPLMLIVAASNVDGNFCDNFSNYGANSVHIIAPGENIFLATKQSSFFGILRNPTVTESGTSFAAPTVTGAIVLIKSYFPNLNPIHVFRSITESTIKDKIIGKSIFGVLDVNGAILLAEKFSGIYDSADSVLRHVESFSKTPLCLHRSVRNKIILMAEKASQTNARIDVFPPEEKVGNVSNNSSGQFSGSTTRETSWNSSKNPPVVKLINRTQEMQAFDDV